jgi:adenylyltransferase/sulfurtransferase
LINDLCVKTDKTFISGSIFQYQGQIAVFNALINEQERSGTYRCLFPYPPSSSDSPSCDQIGVLGAVAGFIGSVMALETIKVITGIGNALINKYVVYDLLNHHYNVFNYSRNDSDISKIKNAPLEDDLYYQNFCHAGSNNNNQSVRELTPAELKQLFRSNEPHVLVDVRETHEHELLNIGGLSIPLNDLRTRYYEIPRDKKVIIYCQVGQRSNDALNYLQLHKGYTNVYQLKGGIRAYMNS